jgi:endonuclease-3 related protein
MPEPADLLSVLPGAMGVAGDEPFEVAVTAYLFSAQSARAVPIILGALRDAGLLDPEALAGTDHSEVVAALSGRGLNLGPSRLAPLRTLARWWLENNPADESRGTAPLRESLASCTGIGPKTADAILLWALARPVMPVSRAVYRILVRHGWLDNSADYDEAAETARRLVGEDAARLVRLSKGLEAIGAEFCRVAAPRCERCPLRPWLPEEGPREPD